MRKFWYVALGGLPSSLPPQVLEVEAEEIKDCRTIPPVCPTFWMGSSDGPYELRRPITIGVHVFETREQAIDAALLGLHREKGIIQQRIDILEKARLGDRSK